MAFTPFIEETLPFPALSRPLPPFEAGDRVLFGSDFPNIPYGYVEAMRVPTDLEGVDDDCSGYFPLADQTGSGIQTPKK